MPEEVKPLTNKEKAKIRLEEFIRSFDDAPTYPYAKDRFYTDDEGETIGCYCDMDMSWRGLTVENKIAKARNDYSTAYELPGIIEKFKREEEVRKTKKEEFDNRSYCAIHNDDMEE